MVNATLGAKLLSTHDDAIATSIALQLDDLNKQRRDIEAQVLASAILQADEVISQNPDTKVLIVSSQGWHEGVIAIAAGRLKDKYHRPAIVIALDEDGQGKRFSALYYRFSLGDTIMAASSPVRHPQWRRWSCYALGLFNLLTKYRSLS